MLLFKKFRQKFSSNRFFWDYVAYLLWHFGYYFDISILFGLENYYFKCFPLLYKYLKCFDKNPKIIRWSQFNIYECFPTNKRVIFKQIDLSKKEWFYEITSVIECNAFDLAETPRSVGGVTVSNKWNSSLIYRRPHVSL